MNSLKKVDRAYKSEEQLTFHLRPQFLVPISGDHLSVPRTIKGLLDALLNIEEDEGLISSLKVCCHRLRAEGRGEVRGVDMAAVEDDGYTGLSLPHPHLVDDVPDVLNGGEDPGTVNANDDVSGAGSGKMFSLHSQIGMGRVPHDEDHVHADSHQDTPL